MAQINFDASQVPDQSRDPVPAGDYMVWIQKSDMTSNEPGKQSIWVQMEVIQPEQMQGRSILASFTLESPNQQAAEIGRRVLAQLCRAIGVMAPRDTEELHGIPFWVRVDVKTLNDGRLVNNSQAFWNTSSQAPPPPKAKSKPNQAAQPQAWQQPQYQQTPAPQQVWQQPAPAQQPVQQMMNLQPTYRTGPLPVAPAQQQVPPWAQQQPASSDDTSF